MADVKLIDAVALIADGRICGNCKDFECCDGNVAFCESARVRRAINEAPTANAEPVKHGRWIYPYPHRDICRCTNCKFSVQDKINNVFEMFNYCPNCGAKMDGGED